MTTLRVAAAQSISVPGDVVANVAVHGKFISAASACKVDLLVFPELSLSGYELPRADECALAPDAAVLAPIRELAVETAMTVIVGAPIVSPIGRAYIGAITFFPSGAVSVYCKRHLHAGEERYVVAGDAAYRTYALAGETVGLAICADTAHEQHPQMAAAAGTSLYVASVLVSEAGYPTDAGNLQRYAMRYRMATLMANHGGPSGGYVSAGKSAFWSPDGNLVVAAAGAGECLVIASKQAVGWTGEVRHVGA